jgi:cobyrinic acid a,c-diamide synthase
MTRECPRIVVAGTASGVGKTSLGLGLARVAMRRGLRVQTFKVGPDFLDPTHLTLASGRTCYNLDGWMTSPDYVRALFARATADADLALIEGVMGLFDGASPTGLEGSTAEIAQWLDAPVLLVVGAHGAGRSLAATAQGFARFEPGVRIAGVIANQGGSQRHRAWLSEALDAAAGPPLVGMLPRGALAPIPSRHLGLVAAEHAPSDAERVERLADACQQHLDLERVLSIARSAPAIDVPPAEDRERAARGRVRLGVAHDRAFRFYYPDNLEQLARHGAELVCFSPLADARLPANLDALYFGGGYPELAAVELADNASMRADVRAFAESGRPVYGECGGLMYLGRALATLDGRRFPMAGALPIDTAMLPKFKTLGYAQVAWTTDTLWGAAGDSLRGHEFHYSEITADDSGGCGWRPACTVRRRRAEPIPAGFAKQRVLAGYVHLHWASRPDAVQRFLSCCEAR